MGELTRLTRALGCPVKVYPGENEMAALAKGALRVLYGKEAAREYPPQEAAAARACARSGKS